MISLRGLSVEGFSLWSGAILTCLFLTKVFMTDPVALLAHSLVSPPLLGGVLKSFFPALFNGHRSIVVPALYVYYTLYINRIVTHSLAVAESRSFMAAIMNVTGLPCIWLGSLVELPGTKLHIATLFLAYAMYRHKGLYIPAHWTPAARVALHALQFSYAVLAPALCQYRYYRYRAARRRKTGAELQELYTPTFMGPSADRSSKCPYSLARHGPSTVCYKLQGLDPEEFSDGAISLIKAKIKGGLEARLAKSVAVNVELRRGCTLIRLGAFSREEGEDTMHAETELLPTVEELRAILPPELRDRVTNIRAGPAPQLPPDCFLSVWAHTPAVPFPPALLNHGPNSVTVPISLTLGARWCTHTGEPAPHPSPSSICSSFAPVCWIGRRLDKLQVQGDPEWGLETDAEGNIIATCSFTVLVEPLSDMGIEPHLPISYALAGLQAKGLMAAAVEAPVVITLPILPTSVLTELSTISDASRHFILRDIAQVLDFRTSIQDGDMSLQATILSAADHVHDFATRRGLTRLTDVAAWLRTTPPPVPPPAASQGAAGAAGNPPAPSLSLSLVPQAVSAALRGVGLCFHDPTLEASYRHERLRAARRRGIRVSLARQVLAVAVVLAGAMNGRGLASGIFWVSVLSVAAADHVLAWLALSCEDWLHGNVPLTLLELLSAAQASWLPIALSHIHSTNAPVSAAQATRTPTSIHDWARNSLLQIAALTLSSAGPLATATASAAVTRWSPEPAPGSLRRRASLALLSAAAMFLAGLAAGCAMSLWSRARFLDSVFGPPPGAKKGADAGRGAGSPVPRDSVAGGLLTLGGVLRLRRRNPSHESFNGLEPGELNTPLSAASNTAFAEAEAPNNTAGPVAGEAAGLGPGPAGAWGPGPAHGNAGLHGWFTASRDLF